MSSKPSNTRRRFTNDENKSLLEVVLQRCNFEDIEDLAFWEQLAKKGCFRGRSPRSLKKHFVNSIIKRLDDFPVDDTEKEKLLSLLVTKVAPRKSVKTLSPKKTKRKMYSAEDDRALIGHIIKSPLPWNTPSVKYWQNCSLFQKQIKTRGSLRARARALFRDENKLRKLHLNASDMEKVLAIATRMKKYPEPSHVANEIRENRNENICMISSFEFSKVNGSDDTVDHSPSFEASNGQQVREIAQNPRSYLSRMACVEATSSNVTQLCSKAHVTAKCFDSGIVHLKRKQSVVRKENDLTENLWVSCRSFFTYIMKHPNLNMKKAQELKQNSEKLVHVIYSLLVGDKDEQVLKKLQDIIQLCDSQDNVKKNAAYFVVDILRQNHRLLKEFAREME